MPFIGTDWDNYQYALARIRVRMSVVQSDDMDIERNFAIIRETGEVPQWFDEFVKECDWYRSQSHDLAWDLIDHYGLRPGMSDHVIGNTEE